MPLASLMTVSWLCCWQVVPPIISMKDFLKVLDRARPTVSPKDLEVFERFTEEFGEEAS